MAIGFQVTRQTIRVLAAVVLLTLWISPVMAVQVDTGSGLAITDQNGTPLGVFDVIAEPGDATTIPLQFRAQGDAPIAAEAWIANAGSAVNGGVVVSAPGTALEAPATWLDIEVGAGSIEPGSPVERTVTVQVPDTAEPGVYVAAIVLQATAPTAIPDSDASQVLRSTALIAIQVPGEIEATFTLDAPALVQHERGAVIRAGLENTGTVPVFPAGTLTLRDGSGDTAAVLKVNMDAVFTGTSTVLEAPLQPLPPAGTYSVDIELTDADTGATARIDDGTIVIPPGLEATAPTATPEPTQVDAPARADVTFEDASVRAENDPLNSVYVEASIANTGSPLQEARLVLVATHNGEGVEEVIVADRMSLATGVTSVSTRYAPEGGFGTGIWTFSLRLETVNEGGQVTVLAETGTVAKIDLS